MTRSDGTAGLAAERWPVRGMLDHTYQRTASIKYIVVTTKHLVRHFTDAHTWPRLEVKAMAVWVLITTLAVGLGLKVALNVSYGEINESCKELLC